MHHIYKITNKINNKVYVGQSKDFKYRWGNHKKHARNIISGKVPAKIGNHGKYGHNQLIHLRMAEYGIENFEFKILEEVDTQEEANKREKHWVRELNSLVPNGYNVVPGGKVGPYGPEHGEKVSKGLKKFYQENEAEWLHQPRPEEVKEKIKNTLTGVKHTKKRRKNQSEAAKKRWENEEPWNKKKMTKDQINLILTSNLSQRKLAAKMGISRTLIKRVKREHGTIKK